ncbi:acyl dehydratase [Aliidiomarina shirensis]|uniref:Acyl dehydratase n=2 Tax=Aliidiomarina shirensis TaxID=1048642 RepID=A0A432WX91_9GAMM|nr:acyl dehydratase [Aliidiomarina shirensis]
MSSLKQASMSKEKELPALPFMLLRAVPTMIRRRGHVSPNDLHFTFQVDAIAPDHLAKYKQAFPGLQSKVPLTYFYLLAQRAHLAAMLDPEFPWPILGMVHVANAMAYHNPPDMNHGFTIDVNIEMPERAATRKRVRPIYKVEFFQNGLLIAECMSTYQVGGGEPPTVGRRREAPAPDLTDYERAELWQLGSDLGRSYAHLSGDYNPIHLHPWLSRWFGFSRPIIHGMYSVAQAQSDLEKQFSLPVIAMDIAFRRPLILPANAALHYQHKHKKLEKVQQGKLIVTDAMGKKVYLDGEYANSRSFEFK